MTLPVEPPVRPMLAKAAAKVPAGEGWWYEPKWDGFRALVFREGDRLEISSRSGKDLKRYFPELVGPLLAGLPDRAVVDGEVVLVGPQGLDFDLLGQRIHPAASRIDRLAAQTPADFVAFDLLALGGDDLREAPFSRRRELLVEVVGALPPPVHVTPATTDHATAVDWFNRFEGAGLDGVVAKASDSAYTEGKRTMVKVKHERTADMVVAGWRRHKDGHGVGSLLLGLYAGSGQLQHLGVASSFKATERVELLDDLAPHALDDPRDHPWAAWMAPEAHDDGQRLPGAPSRWSGGRDQAWFPLRPELVAEVGFNQLTAGRLRHPARFVRWRPDREAASCTYDQLEVAAPAELAELLHR